MNGNAQIAATRETMERIAALLLSMAVLAERAAFAPRAIRFLVLWALFWAETVATDFVLATASFQGQTWSPAISPCGRGFEPADAVALGTSLRTLALVLRTLSASLPDWPLGDDDPAFAERTSRLRSGLYGRILSESGAAGSSVEPRDTS